MQAISNAGYAGYEVMQILVGYEVINVLRFQEYSIRFH